jgi:hypothetical protein
MIRRSDDALVYNCKTEDVRTTIGAVRCEMKGEKLAARVVFLDFVMKDAITDKHRTLT